MQDAVKPLSDLTPGQSGRVVAVGGSTGLRQRLIAMGVTPGAWLIVRKFAPFGGSAWSSQHPQLPLSIRRKDARHSGGYAAGTSNHEHANRPGRQPQQRQNHLVQPG
jgi:Fe2+ transport system protein FeoA